MKREIKISSPVADAILVMSDGSRALAKLGGQRPECLTREGKTFRYLARLRNGVAIYRESERA